MSRHGKAVLYFALLHVGVALSVILGPRDVVPDYAILFEYMP